MMMDDLATSRGLCAALNFCPRQLVIARGDFFRQVDVLSFS
jgi:hypothetical protein